MNKFILIIKNLSKSFHFQSRKVEVLKNLNFSLKKGELIALTGPSGSGKSTLLHLIALMELTFQQKTRVAASDARPRRRTHRIIWSLGTAYWKRHPRGWKTYSYITSSICKENQ